MIKFHDPDQFDWVQTLKEYYPDVKREWEQWPKWLRAPYKFFRSGKQLEKENLWYVVPLMNKDKPIWFMKLFFPKTTELLDKIPVYENMCFSVFYPGAETVKHVGWTDRIVRVHLAIDTHENCTLHCVDESRTLKNGEVLVFEDGLEHWAYNHSSKERTVLLFDVHKDTLGL